MNVGKMDFTSLLKGNNTMAENMTGQSSNKMVESLLPLLQFSPVPRLLMLVYQAIGSHLGFDPTVLLTLFGSIWAINRVGRQIYHIIYAVVQENFMSSIHISNTDDIYAHMMKFLAGQPKMTNSRSLTAETVSKSAWEDEEELEAIKTTKVEDSEMAYLNFSNQEAKAPPRYVPALGTHGFWWNGTYFRLHRKQQSLFDDSNGFSTFKDKEDLVLSCFGRSPEPIKALLRHVKEFYYHDHFARTTIKRPSPQQLRRWGGRHNWTQVAVRPVRPMRTVVLDHNRKSQVLADMNEYLHPATPRWYANRGIPLRRGYLFFGAPGTGKTSLSFALAGVFGLDIYVISLLEPTLTEEDLGSLFNSLPRRCVVLLEDIDTAGLRRPPADLDETESKGDGEEKGEEGKGKSNNTKGEGRGKGESREKKEDWKVSDLARALKKETADVDKKGISLSGLLNAIDGVASHEGRVLIMTTNKPENLDAALVRPGRVDLQVAFTNATQYQAQELFQRMYEADTYVTKSQERKIESETGKERVADDLANLPVAARHPNGSSKDPAEITPERLLEVAKEFGAKIPDGLFSPAEIQGFLLKRKKDPLKALMDTDVWVEGMVKQKASKTKILNVQ